MAFAPKDAREAVADAWASVDGKLDAFRAGRGLPIAAQPGGHYVGYLCDADALIERIERRGYRLVLIHTDDEMTGVPV